MVGCITRGKPSKQVARHSVARRSEQIRIRLGGALLFYAPPTAQAQSPISR